MRDMPYLMGCGQKPWVPLIGITRYITYAPISVTRQLESVQSILRITGITQYLGVCKRVTVEMLENIRQD